MKWVLCNLMGHKFRDWQYIKKNSCEQKRTCSRCGHVETRQAPHRFGDWAYLENGACQQTRTCVQCGLVQERTAHEFEKWRYIASCKMVRNCFGCEFEEYKEDHHWTLTGESVPEIAGGGPHGDIYARTAYLECTKCGKKMEYHFASYDTASIELKDLSLD